MAYGCNLKEAVRKGTGDGMPQIRKQFGHKAGSLAKW